MSKTTKSGVPPDLAQLYVDKHLPVTVDLELMGVTLDEYFGKEPYLEALRDRVRFHRWRLLHDDMRLWEVYLVICKRQGLPEIIDDMNADNCVTALQLLERVCVAMGTHRRRAHTNWEALQ